MTTLIKWIRAGGRLVVLMGGAVFGAATVPRKHASLASRARWLQGVCQRALGALGVESMTVGATSGEILVANHVSYLDILVLAASRPVVFVAKREVRAWPIFGWFARRAGTCFINRERRGDVSRVVREFIPAIAEGITVVLFLEGTSTDGRTVKPFKSSLLAPAVSAGWAVAPAAIAYTVPPGHEVETEVCWWGEMRLMPHLLHLLQLPQIGARLALGRPERDARDRKTLALTLHGRVTDLLAVLRPCRLETPRPAPARATRRHGHDPASA